MRRLIFFALAAILALSCSSAPDYTSYVDVKIGSGAHGHVFVGANVPFGMVMLGPIGVWEDWDMCSGYHDSDSTVMGFSHTRVPGTGIGDMFDITVMPVCGSGLTYAKGEMNDCSTGLWSLADRSKEIAVPGYYSVPLLRYNILAEMTATERVGLERFTFPDDASEPAIVFDMQDGKLFDSLVDENINIIDNNTIEGYRYSTGWAKDQKVYFRTVFSKCFSSYERHGHFWRFDFPEGGVVMVKTAISANGTKQAGSNLEKELPHWNFEEVRQTAAAKWNAELGKIRIETSDPSVRTIFYTAMYHAMASPILISDKGESDRYTVFSLWDTYRALMPLMTIVQPEREGDFMASFLDIFATQGKLPIWHLWNNETDTMMGYPGIICASDAILKDIPGFDYEAMYQAMKASALLPERGNGLRDQYGYIPCDLYNRSVAEEEEKCIADGALAKVAQKLGHSDDAAFFLERSHSYRKHFDPVTGFMRGLDSKGNWKEPFDPYFSDHSESDYCEGNAWQYIWLCNHDLDGLVECFGGVEPMLAKLDSTFAASTEILGSNASPDMTGLIGQYVHGNEPSHHTAYIYAMAGQSHKTADLVRKICSELYLPTIGGICGNEDCGQMSAWYILSAMGLYQFDPAGGQFVFGSPILDKAVIELPEGKTFTVKAKGNSAGSKYIASATLNGVKLERNYITYNEIMEGGELAFEMAE